jgi:hypothetical protein
VQGITKITAYVIVGDRGACIQYKSYIIINRNMRVLKFNTRRGDLIKKCTFYEVAEMKLTLSGNNNYYDC